MLKDEERRTGDFCPLLLYKNVSIWVTCRPPTCRPVKCSRQSRHASGRCGDMTDDAWHLRPSYTGSLQDSGLAWASLLHHTAPIP